MKKLIALLMAMMMVFSCASALAEAPAESLMPAFEIPSFTVSYNMDIDEEQMLALIAAGNEMPEEGAEIVKALLPMLNGLGEKIVFADNGLEYILSLKGQEILSLVADATENGFALATNLIPSYVLTLQQATIQNMMESFTQQVEEESAKLDMELLQKAAEKLMGYAMEMSTVYQSLVTMGEPVKGEYADLIEGVVFNTEIPLTVDTKGMMDAQKEFIAKVLGDEDIKAAVDSIVAMVPGASFDPAEILSSMENTEEVVPEVAGLVYVITDDEGNQTAPNTYVMVSADVKEHPEGNTNVYVYVSESSLDILAEVPAQEVSFEIYGEMLENGLTGDIAISAEGMDIEIVLTAAMNENGVTVDEAVYFNGAETPIEVCTIDFAMGGERTKKAVDGEKAELAVESFMDEATAGEAFGNLLGDLMMNGLGGVLENIKTAAPEQAAVLEELIGQILSGMGLMEEAPAEEVPAA